MKILKLRFKNINSLRGEHLIDFTIDPLSNSGIFAIVGPTGSGKSTLLDVITLALFNKTPRIGNLTKSTIESFGAVITRNTDEAYAEIEYESQIGEFRSKWMIKKARTGSMRDYEMELYSLTEDKFIDIKRSEVPDRNADNIGLTYEQFLKSIILSQGDFARFIKESPNERANLLEKITGTEIYRDLGKAAFERFKSEKQTLDLLDVKLAAIKILSPEERETILQQIDGYASAITEMQKQETEFSRLLIIKSDLQKIRNELSINELNLQEAEQSYEYSKPDFDRLSQHENLFPIKPEIDKWQSLIKNIDDTQKAHTLQEQKLKELDLQHEVLSKKLAELHDQSLAVEKSIASSEPMIEEALALDISINHAHKQLQQLRLEVQLSREKVQKIKDEVNFLSDALQANLAKLDSAKRWKAENEVLAEAILDINLIEDGYRTSIFKMRQNRLIEADGHLPCSIEFSARLKRNHDELAKQLEKLNEETKRLVRECEYAPEDLFALNAKIISFTERINDLHKQSDISNLYLNISKKNSDLGIFISDLQNQEKTVLLEIIEQKDKLVELEKCRLEVLILLERQQLEAKYEEDRAKLVKGEACYLCGALHHPYVRVYTNYLSETKNELKKCDDLISKYQELIRKNQIDVARYESKIGEHKRSLDENCKQIEKLSLDFNAVNNAHELSFDIADYDKIKNYIHSQVEDKKGLELSIRKIEKLVHLKQRADEYIKQITVYAEVISETERLMTYVHKYQLALKLAGLFNFDHFLSELSKNIRFYKAAIDKISTLEKEVEVQRSSIGQKTLHLNETLEYADKRLQEESLHAEQFGKMTAKRNSLGIADPLALRSKLQKDQKSLSVLQSECEAQLSQIKGEFTIVSQMIEGYKVQLSKLGDSEKGINANILNYISRFGYKTILECIGNIIPIDDVNRIKKIQQDILNKTRILIENKQQLIVKSNELIALDNEKYSRDELEISLLDVKRSQDEHNRLIGELRGKQTEDDKSRLEAETIRQELDVQSRIYSRWSKLKDLIGDATGQKFSKYAQDLSLTILIELANQHLVKFTDRYYIVKKDVDDLIIVDTYLADSERSVKTLSGGETFLVSLALSLGLSDLASSNAKLACLFIDEGFGTLDAASLDIALDALEKLQVESQRVIGIISHVQALKDRITTQIELVKLSGGYSKIYIHQ